MAFVSIAAALAAAGALPLAPSSAYPLNADPAMWVVNDRDTTIYLFGTFHALDGSADWFNDEVKTAFVASDELVLETLIPERLPPKPFHAASATFLDATRIAVRAGRASGMKIDHGADMVLSRAARDAGKPVGGLESFDSQLSMFANVPAATSPKSIQDPRVVTALAELMTGMQSEWSRGEQGLFAAMLGQMQLKSPESYRLMFTRRNESWAQWIAERLDRPGTVFVAVGAGHLVGRDSVQAKLSRLGVKSARIN